MQVLTFVRGVAKPNQHMVMLPGNFSGSGDWAVDSDELNKVVSSMLGRQLAAGLRSEMRITIENASANQGLGRKLSRYLSTLGYSVVAISGRSEIFSSPQSVSKIIAEKHNPQEAALLKADLQNRGEIINASIGDIQSSITLVAGDDLTPLVETSSQDNRSNYTRRRN
jgi:hypothetical protein